MSLTTPVPRDFDAVFPGENWFYYWKTSSSLWRTKLEASPETGPVIVPLNWSFHSETGERYDFAQNRPETNLKRLTEVVESLGRKTIFLIPLTPAPFLANGGIPHLLARTMSLDELKMGRVTIGPKGQLNKLYSFYDPRVFQGFTKFVHHLGDYFTKEGISSDVYGIECGHLARGQFESMLKDHSKAFDQAFSRFLKTKSENSRTESFEVNSVSEERALALEFQQNIYNLYEDAAQEGLAGNWEGAYKLCFLGASPSHVFERIQSSDTARDYSSNLFSIMCRDYIPSSSLLPARIKKGVLKKQLEEMIDQSYVEGRLGGAVFEDDLSTKFRPLSFFEFYEGKSHPVEGPTWEESGLIPTVYKRFLWSFKLHQGQKFRWTEDIGLSESYFFIRGQDVDDEVFTHILKHFMGGGLIVLDRYKLDKKFEQKLETFFLENGLNVEKVNIGAPIHYIALGPGRLITVETSILVERPIQKRMEFWDQLIKTFDLLYLELPETQGVDVAWRTRGSSPSELNFQEVRRLSLYNPSSYRKKMKIPLGKHFALTRVVNESQVKIHSTGQEVEIELLPEGSVSIDLGVFS